ncbi:gliding motility-associated-like protein [Maribacter vaceletii]|uniref:Gliding motility-associated-like protein n=1 Tax=Maribacter vaceletii TaxID=1206816 RepID=A0A495DSD6_9FLAO|nr:gliding motility-associated C-terminal domain-containing protein [Maribacter vaceletii]RKR06954.1 gliding motility-associated-like protein [Maribacter vaceletii]
MKKLLYIFILIFTISIQAQTALFNNGSIQIHDQGQLGFHTNFINNAPFDGNLGLAGFYGTYTITIAGAFVPQFYDTEIANEDGVLLSLNIDNTNNTNFIVGDFRTIKTQSTSYLNFLTNAAYVGSSNFSKVDGYVAITNQQNFTFPVGDSEELRPLILNSSNVNSLAKCAYFRENPDNPSSLNTQFNTQQKPVNIKSISTREFWRLEGNINSTVSISWNQNSQLDLLTDDVNSIVLVGWNKTIRQWINLKATNTAGDLTQGFVTSDTFNPDNYEIITFASVTNPDDLASNILTLENYLITPNGDGNNDTLVIPELELSPNNTIRIYDRYGLKVYEDVNYTNNFNGFSNVNSTVFGKEKGLPIGVYFYIITMQDLQMDFQGFMYLAR